MPTSDRTDEAFDLIEKCAPERKDCLKEFRLRHSVQFVEVRDRRGIVLNANKDRVQFACKDLHVMWYLSFTLWKSIELIGPSLAVPKLMEAKTSEVLSVDKALEDMEMYYRGCMNAVGKLLEDNTLDREHLPPDIPGPVKSREDLKDPHDIAVFDLVMMAYGVLFLHELKHVEFHAQHDANIPRPKKFADEERQCDAWARNWLMSGVASYAKENGCSCQEVSSKRAVALLLVAEYLRLAKNHTDIVIDNDYPPLAERIECLSGGMPLPDADKFWIISACILLAECRRQHKVCLKVDGLSPKSLTRYLTRRLST